MESKDSQNPKALLFILNLTKYAIVVISIVMVFVTLAQVIFRYLVGAPLPWSEELSRYCFVWIVFLGTAVGLSRGVHLGVDIFVNMIPVKLQRILNVIVYLMIAGFACLMIYASIPVLQLNTMQRSPALGIQMSWVYLAIPVSMVLIAIVAITLAFRPMKRTNPTEV